MTWETERSRRLATLTERQIDGLECVLCGRSARETEMSPAGRVGNHLLFRCFPDCPIR